MQNVQGIKAVYKRETYMDCNIRHYFLQHSVLNVGYF